MLLLLWLAVVPTSEEEEEEDACGECLDDEKEEALDAVVGVDDGTPAYGTVPPRAVAIDAALPLSRRAAAEQRRSGM